MEVLKITGGKVLSGVIEIGGAKNSAVALVPAAILADRVKISNVPDISDIKALNVILNYLGADFISDSDEVVIDTKNMTNKPITLEYSKMLRASSYFMGALLGKYKHAEMYFPGGCSIGARPIDLHLYGFEKLGAKISNDGDRYIIDADKLIGADIDLSFASVGATINILLASVLAEGKTVIRNAALEPEVGNVVDLLNNMGAKISGKDSSVLVIEGVSSLHEASVSVIPDRIEAGTYIMAGVMNGKDLKINNIVPAHVASLTDLLLKMGADIKIFDDYVVVNKVDCLKGVDVVTEVYPGFPTDLQQPITSLLTIACGESRVTERIYENRFQNVPYLVQMGADISVCGDSILIKGPASLKGCEVITTDLRAGAALILAALSADGQTTIKEIKHVLRGYENLIKKLTNVGGEIFLDNV